MTSARATRQLLFTITLFACLHACGVIPLDAQTPATISAKPTIRVEVSPRIQLLQFGKGGTVLIRVTTPRNPQNRAVCIVVDGPMLRSSCWDNGPTEALRREFRYAGLPAGEYVVAAVLEWVDEEKGERKTVVERDSFEIRSEESSEF